MCMQVGVMSAHDCCKQSIKHCFVPLWFGCGNACVDLLVEFQIKDEGCAEGLHQEAALGQMDGLREGGREEGDIGRRRH